MHITNFRSGAVIGAVAAAGMMLADAASAYERWVDIVNNGNFAIYSVRISHVDRAGYGPDLLGRYVIPVGDWMRVEPLAHQGYCRFDVLITYENGAEVALWGVNLCEATAIGVSDFGYAQVAY